MLSFDEFWMETYREIGSVYDPPGQPSMVNHPERIYKSRQITGIGTSSDVYKER